MTMAQEITKPHIALLPSPGIGHLVPLLEFAKHLVVHHNVHVSFLVINSGEVSAMQDQLLHSSALPADLHVIHLPQVNISSSLNDSLLTRLSHICLESMKHLRETLVELNLPKALIIDMFTTDAISVCEDLGVPVYSFFTSTTKGLAWALWLPQFEKECGFAGPSNLIEVPGCNSIGKDEIPDELRSMEHEDMRHMGRLTMVTGIFVNTWEDLESKSSWLNGIRNDPYFKTVSAPPVYPVGPLIKGDETVTQSEEYIMSWLNNQYRNSVLLVSLGSGGTLTTEQMIELASGLEMSKQKFVWVVRKPNDFTSSGAFFSAGTDGDDNPLSYLPEGFVKRTAGVGLVVPSWAPQTAILRHEATGGFLSHCGWNSTLESLVHGIPMIAWPLYAEQKMNAASLTKEIEIAVRPAAVATAAGGKSVVKRDEVERVVRLLMQSEEGELMRAKANKLKDSAEKAMKPGGSSYDLVESIVKSWN